MNILTFDIEDWFHILDNSSTKTEAEWSKFECRLHRNTDRILDFIQLNNIKATFFCLGWIAQKYPEIIKKIDNLGYEIGAHSYMHQLIYEQSREVFQNDLSRSINILQELTGKKVTAYRAPGFSIMQETSWALELLAENGIEIDCSIFPAKRGHGGFSEFKPAQPCIIDIKGYKLKEFPINTSGLFGYNFIFSGGGYFRLLPYSVIKHLSKSSDFIMTYFHPRDFDYEQPRIKGLPLNRKFKSYFGLRSSLPKLQKWVDEFSFIDLKTADSLVDWNKAKIISL